MNNTQYRQWACLSLLVVGLVIGCRYALDFAVTSYVNAQLNQHSGLWHFLHAYSNLGLGWPYIAGFILLFLLSRFVLRNSELTLKSLYLFATVAVSGIVCDILKYSLGRPRPQLFLHQHLSHFTFLGPHAGRVANYVSFPSGHATTAAAVAIAVALLWRAWRVPMVVFMVSIAVVRVLLLRHFVSDVVAGMALGSISSVVLYNVFYLRWRERNHFAWRLLK